ncbi:MAG: acyl carrier protein [Bacteroidales bacterium]|nr:acyl carrier protein [Bacteroidales bacterium]
MKIEDFIAQLEEEYEDIAPHTLKPDSVFREVFEWSSINALILIALVKTQYDVVINAEDIANSQTVQDLFTIIQSRATAQQ